MMILALASIVIWTGLLTARGGFWRARQTDEEEVAAPQRWPEVTAIVPATR
ncbi:MAG: hypothetical protein WDN08_04770 [Rhizomicrobium sp.]